MSLLEEIRTHLMNLPSHARERRTAMLLTKAEVEILRLRNVLDATVLVRQNDAYLKSLTIVISVASDEMRQMASRIAQRAANPTNVDIDVWAKQLADDVSDAND